MNDLRKGICTRNAEEVSFPNLLVFKGFLVDAPPIQGRCATRFSKTSIPDASLWLSGHDTVGLGVPAGSENLVLRASGARHWPESGSFLVSRKKPLRHDCPSNGIVPAPGVSGIRATPDPERVFKPPNRLPGPWGCPGVPGLSQTAEYAPSPGRGPDERLPTQDWRFAPPEGW